MKLVTSPLLAVVLAACAGGEPEVREPVATPATEVQQPAAAAPEMAPGSPVSSPGTPPVATPDAPPERAEQPRRSEPAPPPAAATPARAPETGPGQQDEGARVLRAAAAVYENIRSMQADFTMFVENPLLRSKTTSRGTLYQRRPDRILLRFSEPAGDIIVGDGTYFWIYYPSSDPQQVFRAPASQAGQGGVDLQAQFVGDPVTRFDYTLHAQESVAGRPAHVLTLRPKSGADYASLKVWIDARDSLVRRFEITEHNSAVRRFDLDGLQTNVTLNDALFRFTPPAGVRVVERN